ncbi:MAG TPA: PDZ domain-containing protein [Myxococcales bacterium]|nr:PDZ domain-containing protein [Myxococcales bacterium]
MNPVAYRVSVPDPRTHLLHVELDVDGLDGKPLVLWLPAWTPGSYLIREFARHVQGLAARGANGKPAAVTRVAKDGWRIEPGGTKLSVGYDVYAFDLSVRTSHVDESHAYWNGAATYLTSDGWLSRPAALRIEAPAGWKAMVPLPRDGDRWSARDYDELCDSPVHCSPDDRTVTFQAAGVPHALAVWGHGNEDLPPLAEDLRKICEEAARLFGGLPYPEYLFLTLLTDRGRGGLEHRRSCTLLYPRFGFRPEKARADFLTLAAHELFHAWNVKRLKPLALTPYRWREENLTRLLWFFEGCTSYYELLLTVRSGAISPARFLELWGERMTQLARTPGRAQQSAEEASFTSWIKHYRPDENSVNSSVSYYLKGSLIALSLDMELRRRGSSLDELLRRLWAKYGEAEKGVPEDGVRAEAEALAGGRLDLFDRAVAGTEDPGYEGLAAVGLRARARARESASDKGGSKPRERNDDLASFFGALVKPGHLTVQGVLAGSPAERAGLEAEDELAAADGFRLHPDGWQARVEGQPPGTRIELAYFRRDELRRATVELGERPQDTYWIERVEGVSEAQRAAFQAWVGHPLNEGKGT